MDDAERMKIILEEAEEITKRPDRYVGLQEELAKRIKSLMKMLYDYNKSRECPTKKQCDILENLIVDNFDEEQIWQEIELQNDGVCNYLVSDVARVLAKKKLIFKTDDRVTNGNKYNLPNDCIKNEIAHEQHSSESVKEKDFKKAEKSNLTRKAKKPSVVDDRFFKLSEMEDFLKKMENENTSDGSEESVDLFGDDLADSENALHYNDFFDLPDDAVPSKNRKRKDSILILDEGARKKKKVSFVGDLDIDSDASKEESNLGDDLENLGSNDEIEYDSVEGTGDAEEMAQDEEEVDDGDSAIKSSYESRQERLKMRINALEEEALKEKPWQLKGEVTAFKRPQNSLLEEYVEFDVASRPAPIITEKVTLKLEDVIRQRIKDKVWDDVVRKIKPVEDPKEYKKRLILNQEKSKLSLSEIYEKEYLREKSDKAKDEEVVDEESTEHVQIKKVMKALFAKLDALSNFHYTPKQVEPEVKIVSHLPAVAVEEVAPVATSDAALLAPEEIKRKAKGDLVGKTERSATDKKRERRKKVLHQRWKRKEKEKVEKTVEKLKPGLGNRYSKDKAKKLLEKVTREKNISQIDSKEQYVKSSNVFFSKLQDEVATHIRKNVTQVKANGKNKKLDAKKIKF